MNYQHLYHAGSHADVFKHTVLMALLSALSLKPKPLCYIDMHAGAGIYDIANATQQEWKSGIGKLHSAHLKNPLLIHYQQLSQDLHYFPGSPLIAEKMLKPNDEIILIEKEEIIYRSLKKLFAKNKQVHIHHQAYETAIKSLLPPKIKRGLVLIDPPYESIDDFKRLPFLITDAFKHFQSACYMIWYPIKARKFIEQFHLGFKKKFLAAYPKTTILIAECCPWPDDVDIRLNGSGLLIINPPFEIEKTVKPLLEELISILKQDPKGFYQLKELK